MVQNYLAILKNVLIRLNGFILALVHSPLEKWLDLRPYYMENEQEKCLLSNVMNLLC